MTTPIPSAKPVAALISDHTLRETIEISTRHSEVFGRHLVCLHQSAGSVWFQFDMTAQQARDFIRGMSDAIMAAEAGEA